MADYQTDDEKVEAIKKWWKENGISVIAGVAIGLGAIFGWRTWVGYRDSVTEQASAAFEQLLIAADGEDAKSALTQSKLLSEKYSSTLYASLATLVEAKIELESGNPAGARSALEKAIATAPDPALARIAALRLTRILIAQGELKSATDLIQAHDDQASFSGAFQALRGDIARKQGRIADARAAYEKAIKQGAPNPELLRLKLNDLPRSS